jgi:hypothetical protein
MPPSVIRYASLVVAAGALLLLLAIAGWECHRLSHCLGYVTMAALASTLKVKLPGLNGTVSPGFAVVLAAIVEADWPETAVLAAVAGVVQCVWGARKRPGALQIAFNAAGMVLSAGAAFHISQSWVPGSAGHATVARIAIATPALFAANTILVAVLFSLLENQNVLAFWRKIHYWTFPHYVLGALVAMGLGIASTAAGLSLPWLALPVLYLQYAHQREAIGRVNNG